MTVKEIKDADGISFWIKGTGEGTELDPFIPHNGSDRIVADETNVMSEYLLNGASEAQNVDGSVAPVRFSSTPVPVGKVFVAARIIIYMESTAAMDSTKFGDLGALANGWELEVNGTVVSTSKTNRGLVSHMFDAHGSEIFGKLDKTLIGRYSFTKFTDGAEGITIRAGETLTTIVNDNLSTLVFLEARVQGMYFDV